MDRRRRRITYFLPHTLKRLNSVSYTENSWNFLLPCTAACSHGTHPPREAEETGRGSSEGHLAPSSSSEARDLPRGTVESRALQRAAGGRRYRGRRAESRAPVLFCPLGPCAAPRMLGLPRIPGEICSVFCSVCVLSWHWKPFRYLLGTFLPVGGRLTWSWED